MKKFILALSMLSFSTLTIAEDSKYLGLSIGGNSTKESDFGLIVDVGRFLNDKFGVEGGMQLGEHFADKNNHPTVTMSASGLAKIHRNKYDKGEYVYASAGILAAPVIDTQRNSAFNAKLGLGIVQSGNRFEIGALKNFGTDKVVDGAYMKVGKVF